MKIKSVFICALSALLLCSCANTANSGELSETVETEPATTTETSVTEEIIALNTSTEIVLSTIADEITTTSIQSSQENEITLSAANIYQERSPIVMISVYDCYAYGFEQTVYALDSDGYYYNYQAYDEADKFDISEDNWYEKILSIDPIDNDEYYIHACAESMENTIYFTHCLADYKNLPLKEYPDLNEYDSGTLCVYGIYYDNTNEPMYVKLCSYGEKAECIDSEFVTDHINQLSFTSDMRYIFYDGFKVKFPY